MENIKLRSAFCLIIFCIVAFGCQAKKESTGSKSGTPCGGTADFQCSPTMFCSLKENCGGYDVEGFCKPRPTDCPAKTEPVCGCDSQTYSSPCIANAAGVTVKQKGSCN